MIKIRCVRFIYLGLPRSGKTTFLLCILGDILNIASEGKYLDGKERPSTGVAKDEGMAVTNWGIAGKQWSRIQGFKNEADILTQFINQLVIPDGSKTQQEIDMGDVLSFLDEAIESEDWNTIEYVLKDMTLMINTDTGGHAEFLDLHSSLVHGPSLNLLFSSLKDSLHDYFDIHYTDEDGKSTEPVDSDMTVEEVLFQALSSIACFGCSKKAEGGTSKVMFVGTHKDDVLPEDFDKKDRLLQNTMKATAFYDKDFIEFFSKDQLMLKVDNMKGGQDEIDEIRACLDNVIKKSFKEIEIRASWLILSLHIRHTDEYQMSLKDCEKIASNLGIIDSADLKKALLFLHHNLGVLLYYPTIKELEGKVICNTQIVYDSATNLIKNTFTFENVGEMAEKCFTNKAMFTLESLKRIPLLDTKKKLSWDELVKLLEYLRIITPMPDQELTYFMPCHLKSARTSELKHSCGESDPAPLLVHFTCGYVPTGVFPFMITWLVSQNFPEWRLIDDGMHKMSLKECEKIASTLGISSDDLQEVLLFLHHNLGVLLYYPTIPELEDKVICNTQIVYDSATNLIKNTFTFENVGEMAEKCFTNKAMFTLESLKRIPLLDTKKKLSWDELVKLLEYLRIITPMPDQELTYFMPCHLKSARNQ